MAEFVLARGEPGAETSARELRSVEVPVLCARPACLIDHLECFQDLLPQRAERFGSERATDSTSRAQQHDSGDRRLW